MFINTLSQKAYMPQFNLHIFEETESTNMLVKSRIAAGDAQGYAALAFKQTAGYGRMRRAWASPAGGLYMSVLLRPGVNIQVMPTISFLVAIAVRRALAGVLPSEILENVKLKWPNDIVLAGESAQVGAPASADAAHQFRKLVGISLELVHGALCIGIGANVFRPEQAQNIAGKNTPVYIAELMGGAGGTSKLSENADIAKKPAKWEEKKDFIVNFAHAILDELGPAYDAWCKQGFAPFTREYESHMCLKGTHIRLKNQLDSTITEGEVLGIDAHGCILINHGGTTRAQASGEVTLI